VAINQGIAHLLNKGTTGSLIEAAVRDIPQPDVVNAVQVAAAIREPDLRGTGFVLNAVQIAFWSVLSHDSIEDAIVAAVSIGDDTDTNAAVAGALAGALHGYEALPQNWRQSVHQHDRLIAVADQLLGLTAP
jgi:ADP-ribosylglycohydrolase